MPNFSLKLVNRQQYPIKHILVVEDIPSQQLRALMMLSRLIDESDRLDVAVSVVPGGIQAWGLIQICLEAKISIDLMILDHDMPHGDGAELIKACRESGLQFPIITFSGIPENNNHLMALGANYCFTKEEVLNGHAEDIIRKSIEK